MLSNILCDATYMGVGGSTGSFGGGSSSSSSSGPVSINLSSVKKKPRKRLSYVTRVTEKGQANMLLKKNPKKIVEDFHREVLSKEKNIQESSLYVNKEDIGKINGLFQQKFQDRFGITAQFKHDIDNRMVVNSLPADKLPEIVQFFKSYGCDVQTGA